MLEPILKPVKPFMDSRGYSFFDIFGEPNSGQINIGNLQPNRVKAFHFHRKQWDHWFCINGDIHIVCVLPDIQITETVVNSQTLKSTSTSYDIRHYYIGEHNPCVLSIPPGWWHGYVNVNDGLSTLLYWVTKKYDSTDPDEERIKWDFFGKDFWLSENK